MLILLSSSSRSVSPDSPQRWKPSAIRDPISLSVAVEPAATFKKTKGLQTLSQPLLLRLRALPVDTTHKHTVALSSHSRTLSSASDNKPLTAAERRRHKVDSVIGPLSPTNRSYSLSSSMDHLMSPIYRSADTTASASGESGSTNGPGPDLTDREKRRKMAKLQRTLGESVPPELVFGQPRLKTDRKAKRRSRSASYARPGVVDVFGPCPNNVKPANSTVISPGATIPSAAPRLISPTYSATTTNSTALKNQEHSHRGRSVTLGGDSAFAVADVKSALNKIKNERGSDRTKVVTIGRAASAKWANKKVVDRDATVKEMRGTVSMDEGSRREETGRSLSNSAFKESSANEEWKRKERGWSGEWNVRNMREVTKALRELKAS